MITGDVALFLDFRHTGLFGGAFIVSFQNAKTHEIKHGAKKLALRHSPPQPVRINLI